MMGQRYYGYSYVTLCWVLLPGFISDQQMMEEQKHQLQDQQQRYDASEERLNRLVKTLATVRAGVEHLAGKLHHVTQVSTTSAVNCPTQQVDGASTFLPECGDGSCGVSGLRRVCTGAVDSA